MDKIVEVLKILDEEDLLNFVGENIARRPQEFSKTIEGMVDYFEHQSRDYMLDKIYTSSLAGASNELATQQWVAKEEIKKLHEEDD